MSGHLVYSQPASPHMVGDLRTGARVGIYEEAPVAG